MTLESYSRAPAGSNAVAAYAAGRASDSRARVVEVQRRRDRLAKERPPLEPTSPEKASALSRLLDDLPGVGAETQCARLRRALLEVGEVTCLEAQRWLDIRHPPARVLNLRHEGQDFSTRWVRQHSERGHEHRTVAYRLIDSAEAAAA